MNRASVVFSNAMRMYATPATSSSQEEAVDGGGEEKEEPLKATDEEGESLKNSRVSSHIYPHIPPHVPAYTHLYPSYNTRLYPPIPTHARLYPYIPIYTHLYPSYNTRLYPPMPTLLPPIRPGPCRREVRGVPPGGLRHRTRTRQNDRHRGALTSSFEIY
jgi:hypothetical protein